MSEREARTAVVTGGDRGIGKDICNRFLEAGHRVINISLQKTKLEHDSLRSYVADLSNTDEARIIADDIAKSHAVTTFVHNAGVLRPASLDAVKLADLDELSHLHVGSAIVLVQRFLPAMRQARFGRVVLISSRGVLGVTQGTSYVATKAGLIGMARSWALELAQDGITVNCIAPGPIETDMFHERIPPDSPQKKKLTESVPVKRLGTPADIGRVVAFLCERESGFITGQTWYVCGGASLGSLSL